MVITGRTYHRIYVSEGGFSQAIREVALALTGGTLERLQDVLHLRCLKASPSTPSYQTQMFTPTTRVTPYLGVVDGHCSVPSIK